MSNERDIKRMFDSVTLDNAAKFIIKRPAGIEFPEGFKSKSRHMQGIQKTGRGEFVVTGSAVDSGYIYFASPENEIVNVIIPEFFDTNGQPLNHVGGCQVADGILVVGYERLENRSKGTSKILFYDIQDIRGPTLLSHLTISRDEPKSTAGITALSVYRDRWLLLVANWDSKRLDFYLSNRGDLTDRSASFGSSPAYSWSKKKNGLGPGSIDDNWKAYQNINMFTGDIEPDSPWFIGMHTDMGHGRANWADLYQVKFDDDRAIVTKKGKREFHRNGKGPLFRYGSGFFLNEASGSFEVYACEKNLIRNAAINRCNKWT